jgi:acetoin utilization deacetylase AcuC-like enzyme
MATLIYTHQSALEHVTPSGHPERVERMKAILQVLASPYFKGVPILEAPRGREVDIRRAHGEEHVRRLLSIDTEEFAYLDSDTVMSPGSLEAALRAVGAVTSAVDAVFQGDAANAFCAMRPPGHHAERDRAMGFCFFNQAAIGALYARDKYDAERVAVVDFDVHHGNGTQDIFWSDENLFYGSTHQMPLYPGTGSQNETGVGNIFNAPLKAGDGGDEFRAAMNDLILPALNLFVPDLVIISAGFDSHQNDPLGSLRLTEEDFAWATLQLMEVAETHCDARVVSVLEGGYDLQGLAASVAVHIQTLMHGSAMFEGLEDEDNE